MLNFDFDKVEKWLQTLNLDNKQDEVNQILYDATVFIYSTAQSNLHSMLKERGTSKYGLKLSQGIARGKFKNTNTAKVYVKTTNKNNPTNGNFHVYFNAKGTKNRYKKSGASTGKLTAKPFLSNAVETQINNTYRYIEDEIMKLLNKN